MPKKKVLVWETLGTIYGGHRWRSAILFTNNIKLHKTNYEMTDIYNIIMESL